jgi:hypothetical protein
MPGAPNAGCTPQGGESPGGRPARRLVVVMEAGKRQRNQPAPPHAVFEALTEPNRDPQRKWLVLLDDETDPAVVESREPDCVVWSSLWTKRPDARLRFDLPSDSTGHGTDLCWTLMVEEPMPDDPLLGHMRKRVNELINGNLRYTFGQ